MDDVTRIDSASKVAWPPVGALDRRGTPHGFFRRRLARGAIKRPFKGPFWHTKRNARDYRRAAAVSIFKCLC